MASNTAYRSLPTGWAPLQRQQRDVDAFYHASSGVCSWSQPFPCDRDEDGLPTEVYEAAMISAYLNFCFFVGEIAFVSYGPTGKVRHTLDVMAHILTGPISFLGFLNGGFMGSFFFFFSLWHFLCDSNRARPSLVRVMPTSREEFWVWFESLWLLIHRDLNTIRTRRRRRSCQTCRRRPCGGTEALGFSVRTAAWQTGSSGPSSSSRRSSRSRATTPTTRPSDIGFVRGLCASLTTSTPLIVTPSRAAFHLSVRPCVVQLGATLSHLSFGMGALGMKGAAATRLLSVFFRMGSALSIVLQHDKFGRNFTAAYTWDLCWMTVILLLTARKGFASAPSKARVSGSARPDGASSTTGEATAEVSVRQAMEGRLMQEASVRDSGVAPLS